MRVCIRDPKSKLFGSISVYKVPKSATDLFSMVLVVILILSLYIYGGGFFFSLLK